MRRLAGRMVTDISRPPGEGERIARITRGAREDWGSGYVDDPASVLFRRQRGARSLRGVATIPRIRPKKEVWTKTPWGPGRPSAASRVLYLFERPIASAGGVGLDWRARSLEQQASRAEGRQDCTEADIRLARREPHAAAAFGIECPDRCGLDHLVAVAQCVAHQSHQE